MKIFYFTATGNCLYAAKKFKAELISIPSILNDPDMENTVFEDDSIGIIFPCYGLITPKIVRQFIQRVKIKSEYIFTIMTYGNFPGDGVNWFVRFCKKNGINISYANQLLMVDNYLPFFDMNQQIKSAADKKIEKNMEIIVNDIVSSKVHIHKNSIFHRMATGSAGCFYNFLFKKAYKKFSVNDNCNFCGVCTKVCPRNNIEQTKDSKPVFGTNCEFCLACANLCPEKAIIVKGEKNSKARFRNENVSLKEIIEANNN